MAKQKQKKKGLPVGRSEDDMSAGRSRINTNKVPNKRPSKSPTGSAVRG